MSRFVVFTGMLAAFIRAARRVGSVPDAVACPIGRAASVVSPIRRLSALPPLLACLFSSLRLPSAHHSSMPRRQSVLQEDTTFRVLRILEQEPSISQRALASRLGLSLGGLNYSLRALVDKGFVKLENFRNNPKKLGYLYVLTPAGVAEKAALTGRFLQRKMAEYETLRAEIKEIKGSGGGGGDAAMGTGPVEGPGIGIGK